MGKKDPKKAKGTAASRLKDLTPKSDAKVKAGTGNLNSDKAVKYWTIGNEP